MKIGQFNFNNEVDTFTIHIEDDGRVQVPGDGDSILAEYDSVQQLAEIYAQARDVKPENLKNWVLLENGDVYSFVLRAGTAGVNISDVEEQLENIFTSLSGNHHPLSIARAKESIMADGAADLVDVLVHCPERDVARDIYDAMSAVINGTAVSDTGSVEEAPVEEVDTRSDLEKYVDDLEAIPGALHVLAIITGQPVTDINKAGLCAALAGSYAFSNVNTLRTVYDNTINSIINDGIGVENTTDAISIITQTAYGTKDDDMKNRLITATRMAGRDMINMSVDIIGQNHIRHTAERISVNDLGEIDLFVRDNVPYIIRFSDTIDAELEAERDAAARQEAMDQAEYDDDGDEYDDDGDDSEYDDEY